MFAVDGIDQFVIFSNLLSHADVARKVGAGQVTSAGFVTFGDECHVCCYGESETLGVKSRGRSDASRISAHNQVFP
jgi:hypothetical protein